MPFADLGGGRRLYWEEHGEGEPLVLVMGLANDHVAWALQVPALSPHFRTITFDNRDVGRSSYAEGPYEIRDMGQDVLDLADALGLGAFHLLGVSMGGAIAQEAALAAPERVRTLTLAVTWAGSGPWGTERSRVWSASAARTPREEHVDYLMLHSLSERFYESPEAVEYIRRIALDNPYPQSPEAFGRQLAASGRHETRDRLGRLRMPVHVIGAEHDILVPVWKSREIARLVPHARLTVIPEAPHGANLERAGEFNAAVLDFLLAERRAAA
jgi:pimeloyl-ACP methyl ester carboxylesterase